MSEATGWKRQREYEDGASRVSRSMIPSDNGSDRENGYSSDKGANWKRPRFDQAPGYDCVGYHELLKDKFQKIPLPYLSPEERKTAAGYFSMLQQQGPRAPPSGEQIETMSPALNSAIKQLEAHDPETFAGWDLPQHLRAPYVHFYHI